MLPTSHQASAGSLSDAAGSSALVASVEWIQGTLLGTVATTIAIVAVSWVGLLVLMGHLDIRRGLTVVAGCFVLFGASSIAAGIQSSIGGPDRAATYVPPPPPSPTPQPIPRPANPDPYAGASVPTR